MIDPVRERRFWDFVLQTGNCWIWFGASNGNARYGQFFDGDRKVYAHRYSYELVHGAIPDPLQLDHLCCNTWCVNPAHLEIVTVAENLQRRFSHLTHCPRGHPYEPDNRVQLKPGRRGRGWCKRCMADRNLQRYHARKLAQTT